MPRGYVIYMPHCAVQPLVYPYAIGLCWHCDGMMNISAWGFGVARFDRMGNFQEPQGVKRATVQGFTLFLCLQVNVKNTHIVVIRSP
jgi:hypothetical protein